MLENAQDTVRELGPEWVGAQKRVIEVEMTTLDAKCAADEWGWKTEFDLAAMTRDMIPKCREMIAKGLLPKE